MKITDDPRSVAEYDAAGLDRFAGAWHIWRGVRDTLHPLVPGDWYATLLDRSAGVDPTVVADTAADLATKLERQRADVGKRRSTRPAAVW